MQPYRMVIRRTGGPEALEREAMALPSAGPGEVLIEQRAFGLNFIDTYHRSGLYPLELPATIGSEAAGVIAAVGEGVTAWRVGDRVGYPLSSPGAYASHRLMPADRLIAIPEAIGFDEAAAILLKGCTVEMLVERCAKVKAGDWVLVHAAAGGVGSLLVPWLHAIGARVVAHTGSEAKARRAAEAGADLALSCPLDALAPQVREASGGGVAVVFDGVGQASWRASIESLARTGLLVSFGNASGPVDAFTPLDLMRAGSLFVTRPTLGDYVRTPETLRHSAERLFAMVAQGVVTPVIGQSFALTDVAEAHRRLEARETTGSSVLLP